MPPEGEKKKILITGFKPFEDGVNITELILKKLKLDPQLFEAQYLVLPVTKSAEVEALIFRTEAEKFKPDFVISLGELNTSNNPELHEILRHESSVIEKNPEGNITKLYNAYASNNFVENWEGCSEENGFLLREGLNNDNGNCHRINLEAAKYMESRGEEYKNNFIFLHLEDNIGKDKQGFMTSELLASNELYQRNNQALITLNQKLLSIKQKYGSRHTDDFGDEVLDIPETCHDLVTEIENLNDIKKHIKGEAEKNAKETLAENIPTEYNELVNRYIEVIKHIMPDISDEIDKDRLAQAKIPPAKDLNAPGKSGEWKRY